MSEWRGYSAPHNPVSWRSDRSWEPAPDPLRQELYRVVSAVLGLGAVLALVVGLWAGFIHPALLNLMRGLGG